MTRPWAHSAAARGARVFTGAGRPPPRLGARPRGTRARINRRIVCGRPRPGSVFPLGSFFSDSIRVQLLRRAGRRRVNIIRHHSTSCGRCQGQVLARLGRGTRTHWAHGHRAPTGGRGDRAPTGVNGDWGRGVLRAPTDVEGIIRSVRLRVRSPGSLAAQRGIRGTVRSILMRTRSVPDDNRCAARRGAIPYAAGTR
jgi:hypothetical protein